MPAKTPADAPADLLTDVPQQWPVHDVERIWNGAAPFSVRRDMVSVPGRPEDTFGRLVLEHPGAVVILAVDDDERVLVLRQYRHPVSARLVELPADVHPYYVATQAHPELRSRPTRPHPMFAGLIEAAITRQRELLIPIDESALRRRWTKDDDEFVDAEVL